MDHKLGSAAKLSRGAGGAAQPEPDPRRDQSESAHTHPVLEGSQHSTFQHLPSFLPRVKVTGSLLRMHVIADTRWDNLPTEPPKPHSHSAAQPRHPTSR